MTKLTKNFSLAELTRTGHNVDNNPNQEEIENLRLLCEKCLQPIRDKFGYVSVSSGYRSPVLNRLVGGSTTSGHTKGQCVDFKVENMAECFEWIKDNLDFDQVINEFNLSWIHIGYNKNKNRKQVLHATKQGGKTIYV